MRGEFTTVQLLVETLEADVKALDANKQTPGDLAQLQHFRDVARYLKQRELRDAAWTIAAFTWWCDSGRRAPYPFYSTQRGCRFGRASITVWPAMLGNVMVPQLVWNAVTWYFFYRAGTTMHGSAPDDVEKYAVACNEITEACICGSDADEEKDKLGESVSARAQRECMECTLCHTCYIR